MRNVNESSSVENLTESTYSGQTTEPQGDRKQGHISVLYTNVRSLIPKHDELLAYIVTEELDVIAITETWGNSSHLIAEFSIAGYESVHKNREYKRGCGVIYVKNALTALKMDKQDAENYDSVHVNNDCDYLQTIYRPHKAQAADDTALYEEIKYVIQNKLAVIIGDFNCPSIDWTSMNGDEEGKRLIEMTEDAFLTQIVT